MCLRMPFLPILFPLVCNLQRVALNLRCLTHFPKAHAAVMRAALAHPLLFLFLFLSMFLSMFLSLTPR